MNGRDVQAVDFLENLEKLRRSDIYQQFIRANQFSNYVVKRVAYQVHNIETGGNPMRSDAIT